MITEITKLKQFGIFHDFSWNRDIPEFKNFNLIYGWNRSGKTTLSRIFSACEKKSKAFKEYPDNGEFKIKTDNNSSIKHSDIENCNLSIKVFNKDFIEDNISFDPSNSCNPIVYISEEDIESKIKLEALKKEKEVLENNLESARTEENKYIKAEEDIRIATALTIKTTVGSLQVRDKYYDYDKSNIKAILDKIGIDKFAKLSDDIFEKYKIVISSKAKDKQDDLSEYELNFYFDGQNILSFDNIYAVLGQLLSRKVISETLERLKDDQDLNNWVKQGFDLHKKKEEKEKCLFCQKPLDDGFLDSLSKHFSKDYEKLQSNIEILISKLDNLKKEKFSAENKELYTDLQNDYKEQINDLNDLIDELNKWIDAATNKLQDKFDNPLSIIDLPEKPEGFRSIYNEIIEKLNTIIQQHNERVDNHGEGVRTAKEKVELHLIAVTIDKQDYKKIKRNLQDSTQVEKAAKKELDINNQEIKKLEQKTSNIGEAIQKINKHLEEFFGRKEIQIELDDNERGYKIKMDGQPASNLSESEKTAIAFSYFIVKVQERDFNIKEGIIFIDDPISSFDSNFIYHCFSVIKNHFEDAGQLFISTHNFELFYLVREWFLNKRKHKEVCEFHMIETLIKENKRRAQLKQLEETLRKYKSEYHYLFSLLCRFTGKTQPEYDDLYIIGNIARRFLEIFTSFKIPTTGDLAGKMKQLKTKNISDIEKGKVYKLIQEYSHGLDLTSTIEHKDKSESKEAIKILLNIIKESDPKHFELLEKNL